MYSVVNEIDVSCFFAVTQTPRGERATAALLLFAVCQRPLLRTDPEDTLPEPRPRIFSESECKGTTILRTDKIFPRFFFMKTQLFFGTPGRDTCKAGGGKHENGGVVQKNRENCKKGVLNATSPTIKKDCLTRAVRFSQYTFFQAFTRLRLMRLQPAT